MATSDQWHLYSQMLRSRLFEEAVATLWHRGLVSGEMHLGTGEEAVNAGVIAHLRDGDAIALDHRGTSPLLMRGLDPKLLMRELLGLPGGICSGKGGHMHLYSKEYLAASSGIVGSSGPAATGFAIACDMLSPGSVAVAFFGEGAINQGMLMESMNLASAWKLPVVFVCKDDNWSITTESSSMTGGTLPERARGLGVPCIQVDGLDVGEVANSSGTAIEEVRSGKGPVFIHARCIHLEGHFMGFQLLRLARKPARELPGIALPITKSLLSPGGAPIRERISGLKGVLGSVLDTLRDSREDEVNDPVKRCRKQLLEDVTRLEKLETRIENDINALLEEVVKEAGQ